MPFGLQTVPSLFQKAITCIYHPIMKSALVYIDDILLFSSDESSHSQLLSDFHELTKATWCYVSPEKDDFIDHLSTAIKPLHNMLKRNAPAWSEEQTKAIRKIKQKVHNLPALSIPTDG
ncbi:Uncharacterized protein Adt_24221 [Abeliophyllum distichum]|uniref:Reverse transcriptase domain-containing protein n=1 Tax=Abeliophyllum distichum TaxID=126358 RepID=A0ABD1SDB5_9LAMI